MHKYLLEQQSDFFREIVSDDCNAMGHTDEHPIPLPESITQKAFDCLLSFLYAGYVLLPLPFSVPGIADLSPAQDL